MKKLEGDKEDSDNTSIWIFAKDRNAELIRKLLQGIYIVSRCNLHDLALQEALCQICGQGENLLEIFLVTAVASVLGIRFFLAVTGYPQLSRRGLHIAHVLIGGVFMMVALVILLAYINKSAFYMGAVLGGFGFGAFIDELGKFLTGDNNYFLSARGGSHLRILHPDLPGNRGHQPWAGTLRA